MLVIKRDGSEVEFSLQKIIKGLNNANKSIEESDRLTDEDINIIANKVLAKCQKIKHSVSVDDIQDIVEDTLIKTNKYALSKCYIKYRYQKALDKSSSGTDREILSMINRNNETVKQDNSNKNPTVNSTQRDYIAGIVSKDLTNRYILTEEIKDAHAQGIIHFHDADYAIQKEHNCDVWNLEDMLQNGCVINNTLIEKPKSFPTACNIATQMMALVASNQYGGQTITLTHLAPFVNESRKKIVKEVEEELKSFPKRKVRKIKDDIIEKRVRKEVARGVQIMQYQINTLLTSNGQTAFVSLFMYLNEAEDQQTKDDLALIIEEVLNQRIQGVKNEKGVWITPTFPKLLYVLEEDNISEGSKYWYLTKLAAKCTAKRMVPDYISEKIMLRDKGDCYPCINTYCA